MRFPRWVERLALGTGECFRCRRPWKTAAQKQIGARTWEQLNRDVWWGLVGVEEHNTSYSETSGCFPLCEGCWAALTPDERLPYYRMLIDHWKLLNAEDSERYEAEWPQIRRAVLEGL